MSDFQEVGHLFFDYFDNLKEVDLRYLHGTRLVQFLGKWLDSTPNLILSGIEKIYPMVSLSRSGMLLIRLKDGEVAYPTLLNDLASTNTKAEGAPE